MNNNPLNQMQLHNPLQLKIIINNHKNSYINKKANTNNKLEPISLQLKPLRLIPPETILNLLSIDICKKLAIKSITNITQANKFINGVGYGHNHRFAICHPIKGVVGCMCYSIYNDSNIKHAELSYFISEHFQQRGFGLQALKLLLKAFRNSKVIYITAQVYRYNIGSQQLLIKAGFNLKIEKTATTSKNLKTPEMDILNYKLLLT